MTIEISAYRLIIAAYFCINSYLIGYIVCDDNGRSSNLVILLTCLYYFLFGALHWFIRACVIGIMALVTILQLRFFFLFLFTKQFDNMDHTKLAEVTNSLHLHESAWGAKSIRYRIFRYSIELVNKRNKYIHTNK